MKKILVIDVGGSNVKMMISEEEERRKFTSGPKLTPEEAVEQIRKATSDWDFDAVALGFPAPVREGRILSDPKHLGKNWAGFDFAKALGKPVRVINDAALQALGSYHGNGRMLFLGLGTGLGSALVWEGHVLPLELGDLPYVDEGIRTEGCKRTTVGPGELYVMGDNRTNSQDSRVFGVVQRSDVVGRAFVRIWPLTHTGWLRRDR